MDHSYKDEFCSNLSEERFQTWRRTIAGVA